MSIKDIYSDLSYLDFFGEQEKIFLSEEGGVVQIWDADLKNKIFDYEFQGHAREARISPDGRFIAADGKLYDRQKKRLVGSEVVHATYSNICFGGGNLVVTSGYHDRGVAIRNVHSGAFEYRRARYPVTAAAISPDEKVVVAVTLEGRCYLWRLHEMEPTPLVIVREDMHWAEFSPDSKWFVVRGRTYAHIFRTDSLDPVARLKIDPGLASLQVASDNLIAIGDESGFVQVL